MYVLKRDGRSESVHFDKITSRISRLCYGLNPLYVDPILVSQKVCMGVYRGVSTSELDELAAETAAHLTSLHPDFGLLAARIAVSNLHKSTLKSFSRTAGQLFHYVEPRTGLAAPMLSEPVWAFIQQHAEALDSAIVYDRDFGYDYFGFKTLQHSYLLKVDGQVVERPQHMVMRVAVGLHCGDLAACIETYNLMSQRWFTHATPTLFNAGTPCPQLSSCFLLSMFDDSIEGIYDTLKSCAMISKQAGGIGVAMSNIRAAGSYIRGTNGTSNGLVPMLRVYNATARYVDQGGGKRKGAFAMYLEPWHVDVLNFLEMKKNHGAEEERARDLFYALWVPDLFMRRVEADGQWALFCPNEAPGLFDSYGAEFDALYAKYEATPGKPRKVVRARQLWQQILESQQETGTPYMLFKDAANAKSNQKNLGTIHCSNLCTEIIQYTSREEIAVCNLASIALPMFVNREKGTFDHERLFDVTQVVTRNLNRIIDINYYPVQQAEYSNKKNRPIGLGVQGLADAFILLRLPFDSPEAQTLNRHIFETIYYAALTASCQLAERLGAYESYPGSPISQGVLQFDMWGVTPDSGRWDWDRLRADIRSHGVRNSLLLAPMPTATTSQILGNNEAFEPYTSNIYVRRTLAGEFVCVSRHLLVDLIALGLWTPALKDEIIASNGSIQNIACIPAHIKALYRTVWEISQKSIIDMAADRGAYIDQSQSLNIHMTNVNAAKLTSMHFYAWKKGLKTGMYYLRTKSATDAIKFTLDPNAVKQANNNQINTAAAASSTLARAISSTAAAAAAITTNGSSNSEQSTEQTAAMDGAFALSPASADTLSLLAPSPSSSSPPPSLAAAALFPSLLTPAAVDDASVAEWKAERARNRELMECSLNNKDQCTMCSS